MTPTDIPAWLWLALAAVGGWLASEVWPFIRDETRVSRRETRRQAADREERIANALERMTAAVERIDVALDALMRSTIITTMRIDEIHRHLRINRSTPPSSTRSSNAHRDNAMLSELLHEHLDALERGASPPS